MSRPRIALDIQTVSAFCESAYGQRWVSPFAADLSVEAQRTVSPTQIHQWTSGARPVPAWVTEALVPVLRRRAFALQRKAGEVSAMARRLEHDLAPMLSPEPDVEDDGPAPRI